MGELAPGKRGCVARIQANRLVVICDGSVVAAFSLESQARLVIKSKEGGSAVVPGSVAWGPTRALLVRGA